jgi:hypothetical protein
MAFMPWSLAYYQLARVQRPGQRQPLPATTTTATRRVKGRRGAAEKQRRMVVVVKRRGLDSDADHLCRPPCKHPPQTANFAGQLPHLSHSSPPTHC